MLDLRFFKNPRFSAASATITLTFFALFGSTFLLTQYFQFVLEYSPLKAGLMTAPVAIGHHGHRAAGAASSSSGSAPSCVVVDRPVDRGRRPAAVLASNTVMSSFVGGGVGAAAVRRRHGPRRWRRPPSRSWARCPKAKAGVGSAVNDTTRQTGGALGVAVIGSVFAARYHRVIDVPDRPARRAPADGARLDRQGPRGVADVRLPAELAEQRARRRQPARSSSGMQLAAWVGTAVVVVRRHRRLPLPPGAGRRASAATTSSDEDARWLASLDDGMLT